MDISNVNSLDIVLVALYYHLWNM